MGGEGERLHSERRKRFWFAIGGLAAIGFVGGMVGGYIRHAGESGDGSTMAWLAASAVVAVAIAALIASWKFFANVDEVEVADNLWGSLVGFYAYATLLPVWWALSKLGLVGQPDHWAIYGASMIVAVATYGYRKWRFS